jgi:hypothetical protein
METLLEPVIWKKQKKTEKLVWFLQNMLLGWEMSGTSSESYPNVSFGISSAELS